VERPQLTGAETIPIKRLQSGTTAEGVDRAHFYRFPTRPFGGAGLLGVDQPTIEDGKEKVYVIDLAKKTTNFGVAVIDPRPNIAASLESLFYANAPIQPWLLGSLDENDVLGIAGTPVNANSLMPSYLFADGSAGTTLAPPGRYYVVVDSTSDPFTGASLAGRYTLRYWVDDVKPPRVQLVTAKVAAGRPTIVARVTDAGAGVDPLSLLLLYKELQVGASAFDPSTGVAVFQFPRNTNPLPTGPGFMKIVASDYQEAKNANVAGDNLMPNTAFKGVRLDVLSGASVTWIAPGTGGCTKRGAQLQVAASSRALISSVIFYDGARKVARVKKNSFGVYTTPWTGRAAKGRHTLTAVVADVAGREARSKRVVRVCG
jgi:hypothetical protein